MRKCLMFLMSVTALLLPVTVQAALVPSDVVTILDGAYGPSSVTIPEDGTETGPPIAVGQSAISGQPFDLYFTEPGTNIISDHLFAPGPGPTGAFFDLIFFSSDGMADPVLGTLCVAGMTCIEETGGVQDVTALVQSILPDPQDFCGGGPPCQITVQSDVVEAPLPATLALVGLGLLPAASLALGHRRR